ncbi:hypothetical protein SLEP1_g34976 [Rubroshorea leprosula]|uniref:Protein yippee-like n=1 Tax=Rubroshorea leprosula TaxID=152421 RepID=A0AAV5KLR7_9ROSI|nr:hypothetical protein SLEP1_g34976 [Rubroshorea leprosula]
MADFIGNELYSCRTCRNPLAYGEDILSKNFKTKSGAGYLFLYAMNLVVGRKEERQLLTGKFTIADIYCSKCNEYLGWQYLQTNDMRQRFKEGKYVLERMKLLVEQF